MSWVLHITVAAVIEHDGKFLLVKEIVNNTLTYNQPAGHLEENESLVTAVSREVYEETGMQFEPSHIIGIYHWRIDGSRDTTVRFAFRGKLQDTPPAPIPDQKIIGIEWMSLDQIKAQPKMHLRTDMVIRCVEDYLSNHSYPLKILNYVNHQDSQ